MFDLASTAFQDSRPGQELDHPSTGAAPVPQELLLCVLDEIDYGVLLIDAQRRICYANHLARVELGTRRALKNLTQLLTAVQPEQDERLASAVRTADQGHRAMVELGPQCDALSLALVPMFRPVERPAHAGGNILVLCGKRKVCEDLSLQFFARSRKLSASELGVLEALCRGIRPEDIARQKGVCVSTVRSQVTNLRNKTGATTTGELINRVSSLPPMVSALRGAAPH